MKKITGVVDYGAGNLYSVLRGLSRAGGFGTIVSTEDEIMKSDYLIVPGVGAFGDGIKLLRQRKLIDPIKKFVITSRPLLGICLGTQLFHSYSNEFGRHKGLNLIRGGVLELPKDEKLPIPHVGWSTIKVSDTSDNSIFSDILDNDYFYFTHSFSCVPEDSENIVAKFKFGSNDLVAAVKNENVIGCQFHPELSSFPGIQILKNFLKL